MEARQLAALGLVFALMGSAVAAQQQRLYRFEDKDLDEIEIEDFTAIQQHTVFLEIIIEEERPAGPQVIPFGAVVGLVKKCERVERDNVFDNAVLWFNDQFLFGDKRNQSTAVNRTPDDALGRNPENSDILPGCFIPDGFMHAVPHPDGDPMVNETVQVGEENRSVRIDEARTFLKLDRECDGCIMDYEESFYVTDPNGHRWLVDRLSYDLYRESPVNPQSFYNPEEKDGLIYVVHLQVDPDTETGFRDQATWAYRDGTTRDGMPRNESVTDDPSTPTDERDQVPSVEYDFLLAVDFDSVNDDDTNPNRGQGSEGPTFEHGDGGADNNDTAKEGNSHPHNPEAQENNPQHVHGSVKLDLFFANKTAQFVHDNPYWDEHGAPPATDDECSAGQSGNQTRDQAVANRSFIVCDVEGDSPFHKHDGSQTIPRNP